MLLNRPMEIQYSSNTFYYTQNNPNAINMRVSEKSGYTRLFLPSGTILCTRHRPIGALSPSILPLTIMILPIDKKQKVTNQTHQTQYLDNT